MNTFIQADFIKFKVEVKELIQYVKKFKILTMNIQTLLGYYPSRVCYINFINLVF